MNINRNILWTEFFFDRLANLGMTYVCISPGSRSTSLTLSAASNKKLKCFVHIDERSSGFFALGLAKASGKPIAVITTSGTATAELYPAIIEAYQQRVPLIICTADRPPELFGRGANQTINQDNIYKNHIRFYKNAGLPSATLNAVKRIGSIAESAFIKSMEGPVHINFPFRKPFEPNEFTDEITEDQFYSIKKLKDSEAPLKKKNAKVYNNLYKKIVNTLTDAKRGLIIAGPTGYSTETKSGIVKLSKILNFPILADASSQLRFGTNLNENIITNYEGFLKSVSFIRKLTPDLILQFGSTPASKAIEVLLEKINTNRYIINENGDLFDPWNNAAGVLKCSPYMFYNLISKDLKFKRKLSNINYLKNIQAVDKISGKIKNKFIANSAFPNECRIIPEVINALSENSHLVVSNSMPVRDFDYFAQSSNKNLIIHTNRGASGIDGIISTALGIQKAAGKKTLLVTGDMAFYYDVSSILSAIKYQIPLVVVLVNNNGGGIFGMLPVSRYGKNFERYFINSHNLNFGPIVKSFGGDYQLIKSWKDLSSSINSAFNKNKFTVLEIKTDIIASVNLRKIYFSESEKEIDKFFK
jgi:2-succinyl-5-enolpyruvyl-6-hydroxy-3-cyclohexene-1-carboxylate synthase